MKKDRILVVVDVQNDFVDGTLGTKEAVSILPSIKKKIENYDGYIVYTKDSHTEKYLNTSEGKNLPVVHCKEGSQGWQFPDSIPFTPKTDGTYLKELYRKDHFSCLQLAHDILELNAKEKLKEIELIGLCTDICIISNALLIKSFLPETKIKVDATCCAGVTPKLHQAALDTMKSCQIEITGEYTWNR